MIIRKLEMTRGWSGDKPLTGSIEFADNNGKVEIMLTESDCAEIFDRIKYRLDQRIGEAARAFVASSHQALIEGEVDE